MREAGVIQEGAGKLREGAISEMIIGASVRLALASLLAARSRHFHTSICRLLAKISNEASSPTFSWS